jgi:GNAT superfamily N-acetyltransferase
MATARFPDDPERGAIPPQLMQRCHENIIEVIRVVARSLPNGHIQEESGIVRVAGGIPGRGNNTVFITRAPSDPVEAIEASTSFMTQAGVSAWRIVALPGAESVVEAAALSAGFRPGPVRPGMVLNPIPARRPSLPPGLRIRQAKDRGLWTTMVNVMMRGYGGEAPDDTERVLPFLLATAYRGYVGFVGKAPVATSVGLSYHGVGGIYLVATLPESRGRGFGSALTWQAAVDARQDGCQASYLQASEMGYPVYARMGYRQVASYPEWLAGPS